MTREELQKAFDHLPKSFGLGQTVQINAIYDMLRLLLKHEIDKENRLENAKAAAAAYEKEKSRFM